MANILSIKVRDGEGAETSVPIHFPSDHTPAAAQTWFDTAAGLLDNLIGGAIIGATYQVDLDVPAGLDAAEAGSRNDAGATLSYANSNGIAHSLYLPSFLSSQLVKKVVDESAEVTAWNLHYMGTALARQATDLNGLHLVNWRGGKQSTRK